ncbi:DUF3859 domain-containing protein [Marinomonas sp. PE14-40]|uniref:DUF3859 domain-containing protein n=1 Tax=Marinomonas sp. PE14-40 TaxID=3060621 RepID=UPI003F667825
MINKVKFSGITVLALLLTACASTTELTADQANQIDAEVLEFGKYIISDDLREVKNDEYLAGSSLVTNLHILKERTDEISADVGTTFGVVFEVNGLPSHKKITFREVMKFPEMTDPDSGLTQSYYEVKDQYKDGDKSFKAFTFEYDWELVKGKWTYQLYYQDTLLAEKSFNVN